MENAVRSERSRALILDAAFAVLAREGPGKLTIEAIAQEGGISKGRVMHQFRTKAAVIEALLEQQIQRGREFEARYHAGPGTYSLEPNLSEQILALQESTRHSQSFALAVLGAVSENPELLAGVRKDAAEKIERIREDADDGDLAVLRWLAARGMVLGRTLGMCPLTQADQDRLFERLLDPAAWSSSATPTTATKTPAKKTSAPRKKVAIR
nr:TetR/AcrR family transcriptional regulator [uncultured Cupriavidus sp.]